MLALLIMFEFILTAYREYEVVETGKPSTALLRKYRNPHPTPGASRVVAEKWDAYVYFWWSHVELGFGLVPVV